MNTYKLLTFLDGWECSCLNARVTFQHFTHALFAELGSSVSTMAVEHCEAAIVALSFEIVFHKVLNTKVTCKSIFLDKVGNPSQIGNIERNGH